MGSLVVSMAQTDIALSAVFRIFLAEIAQKLTAAAYVVVVGILQDGHDVLLILAFADGIDVFGNDDALQLLPRPGILYEGHLALGNETHDVTLAEAAKNLIDRRVFHLANVGDERQADVGVVGEQSAVGAQQGCDHFLLFLRGLVQHIQFVARQQEAASCCVVGFFLIVDVSGALKNMQGSPNAQRLKIIYVAELGNIKEKTMAFSAAYAHLEEVGQVFIDVLDEVDGRIIISDATFQDALVVVVVEQNGISFLAVAARTARFLKVGLDGVGGVVVDDDSDVGLVYAHTEGVGADDDADVVLLPVVLPLVLHRMVEAGMKESSVQSVVAEHLADALGVVAAIAIDDSRTLDRSQDMNEFLIFVDGLAHHVGKILAGETHTDDILLLELQLLLNVINHFWRCRCREGEDRNAGLPLANLCYLEIRGPEVVAPLTDAVGLVDRDEAHFDALQLVEEDGRLEAFGRDVEQFCVAEDAVVERFHDLAALHSAVDSSGDDSVAAQMAHLILHQGDERRDDDAHAFLGEGRHLKGDALAAACRHQPQSVPAASNALDNLALDAAEVGIMPVLLKDCFVVGHSSLGLISSICS